VTRYELLDRIGVGGMAEIFRGKAVAAGGFEKPVAIKRILPHLSQDRRFVELLIAEAKVLSLLKHRNIVQIFDVGLGDDGKYFLVMEYVDGKDLRAVQTGLEVRRRRMPFDLALHVGAEVCEALEHAHSARAPDGKSMSLVHRDVSPSNVLLSRAGEVKLTDFGIAKRAEQEQTGHGAVRGKFAYISPEQARNEHLDPRSDVFSVAILLWELITNRRLFSGLGDIEALRAVRDARVPRPSEIDPTLMPEVDSLMMAALSRDVKNRPTAGQLGAKLRSLRYSLEVTVGDPATELAKIIDDADEVERQSQQMMAASSLPSAGRSGGFDEHTEATVIRIRTADDFIMRDKDGASLVKARQVITQFEEEETRQAQLSGDQLRILRGGRAHRDSEEMSSISPPLPGMPRARRPTDEPTTARPPISTDEVMTFAAGDGIGELPNQRFDSDESTRLVARSRDRERSRTPMPLPARPATQPPPMPRGARPAPGLPPQRVEGTVHNRNPTGLGPPPSNSTRAPLPPPFEPPSQPTPTPLPPQPQPGMMMPPTPLQRPPMMMPPQMQPQMMPPQMMPHQQQPPPVMNAGGYVWPGGVQPQLPPRGASPTAQDLYDQRPMYPQQGQRPAPPPVQGFGATKPRKPVIKPWMLIIGALVMAGLAFFVTRRLLG
jgi:serine/threonine protein kinase